MRRKMKKIAAGILAAMMVLSSGAAGVSAAGHGREGNHAGRGMGDGCGYRSNVCQYADEDADGVCDNYRERAAKNNCCGKFTDKDDDGICDNCDRERPVQDNCCGKFTDKDDDGICDNCERERPAQNNCGKNYTDTDEDGVCDNYETRQGRGCRGGRGK